MPTLNSDEKQLLKTLLQPVQKTLRLAWLMSVMNTVLLIGQMWLLAMLFSHLLTLQFAQPNPSLQTVSYQAIQQHWQLWLMGLAVCFVTRPWFGLIRDKLGFQASVKVRQSLRADLLMAMANLGTARHRFGSDGSLSSQIIEQTEALDAYISRFAVQKMVTVSTPVLILLAVASQSWVAAGILLLTAPLVPVFMILIGHLTARKSAEQFAAMSQLSGRFLDWVRGMTTLKRLQATDTAQRDLANSSEGYRHRTMDVLKIAFLNGAALEFLAALCIALTAVYLGFGLMGILPWQKNVVPVPYFGALFILLLAPEFYAPLRQLGSDYHAKAQAEGAMQSVLPILKAGGKLHSPHSTSSYIEPHTEPLASPSVVANPDRQFATFKPPFSVVAEQLSMTGLGGRVRLVPVSFRVESGQRVAITGDSGSGKSSLLQALMGFSDGMDTVSGKVTLRTPTGDFDLSKLKEDALLTAYRDHLGYLSQQVALMPMSIGDNLRLAKPDASDAELWEVLEAVQLADVLRQLPTGLDTLLGERGRGLSGGQQQRLGIAQLLLQKASLWLLDEPTEHLDPDTAQALHGVLEQVSRGKTVLWVTHHHETLTWLDDRIHLQAPTNLTDSLPDAHLHETQSLMPNEKANGTDDVNEFTVGGVI